MIRIMTADQPAGTAITVDGQMSGEGVEPVETCCIQALSKGKPVQLYLRDVSTIDERGRTVLRNLAAKGVGLTASGIYSSFIVAGIQSAGLALESLRQDSAFDASGDVAYSEARQRARAARQNPQ